VHPFTPVKRPVVCITGTSSGIGLALTRLLMKTSYEYRIVATARTESLQKLREAGIVESKDLMIRALDVRNPTNCRALIQEIETCWGGVDVLINNAGIAYRSVVEHISEDELNEQLETNLIGPINLMRHCLPSMRAKRAGRIINISSVGGMMAMPTMGFYSASKASRKRSTTRCVHGASMSRWCNRASSGRILLCTSN
jgi:Short-chain dehydrogenases of various substrate specificities